MLLLFFMFGDTSEFNLAQTCWLEKFGYLCTVIPRVGVIT